MPPQLGRHENIFIMNIDGCVYVRTSVLAIYIDVFFCDMYKCILEIWIKSLDLLYLLVGGGWEDTTYLQESVALAGMLCV